MPLKSAVNLAEFDCDCLILKLQLLQKRETHFPNIRLSVSIATNDEIEDMILYDKVDFGFLTRRSDRIVCEDFCQEEYVLTGASPAQVIEPEDILKLKFIGFPDFRLYYEKWLESSFQGVGPRFNELNVVNSMSEHRGVLMMLLHGNKHQVTLMPKHAIFKQLDDGLLFNSNPDGRQCLNQIYMGYLEKSFPKRVERVKEEFFQLLLDK